MAKNELRPTKPDVTIRHCPMEKLENASAIARYGYGQYDEWPNSTCVITDGRGNRWYWRCTRIGNITVEYLGKEGDRNADGESHSD